MPTKIEIYLLRRHKTVIIIVVTGAFLYVQVNRDILCYPLHIPTSYAARFFLL